MPYYVWSGVNIFGDLKKGKSFARSVQELDKLLFSRNIALIACRQSKILKSKIFGFFNKISQEDKINFFKQLSVLIFSGVRLTDALAILCDQTRNIAFKQVIFELEVDISSGMSFSLALQKHVGVFDELVVQVAQVGQQSGDFGVCLGQLSDYLQDRNTFAKKLKSSMVLPAITFGFFMVVVLGVFAFIVPQFAEVFMSMGKELPKLTRRVLSFSEFLRSYNFLLFIFGFFVIFLILKKYLGSKRDSQSLFRSIYERAFISTPFFGEIYRQIFLINFLRAISMLLKGGVRLVPAIGIAKKSIKNGVIKSIVENIEFDVYSGSFFSQAMVDYGGKLFPQDLVAIVKVGEETAMLDGMLERAANMYWQKVSGAIFFFTTIFQPLLMIVLGLLVTLLIFAIYVPIFTMAAVI